ncbi:MAG: tyrosine-type recombinase/integrase, partial [Arcobacteraceae bacterium]
LNEQEMLSFLTAIRAESNKKHKNHVLVRNILIVKLLFFTGARINEILMLTCDSIIKANEQKGDIFWIKLKGKRHKERMVCIKVSHIEESLASWMYARKKLIKNNNVQLMFFNSDYKPLSGSSANVFIKKQLNSIGLTKIHMGPHLLRHSFATLLYTKTNDLLLVSEVLGHSNMSITMLYTHIDTMKKWIEIAELFE